MTFAADDLKARDVMHRLQSIIDLLQPLRLLELRSNQSLETHNKFTFGFVLQSYSLVYSGREVDRLFIIQAFL